MTPIERVQERSQAASLLGVSLYASVQELKQAWKRIGFETHPDRNGGSDAAFMRAQDAFELLLDLARIDAPEPDPEPVQDRPTRTVSPRRVSSNLGPGIGG